MSRNRTPKYRVELTQEDSAPGNMCWPQDALGKPTLSTLQQFVIDLENSFRPGGVNAHVGYHRILSATVIHQKNGHVVVEWFAPIVPTGV